MDKVNFFDINLIGTGMKSFAMLALVLACVIFVLYIMRRFLSIGAGTKGEVDMKRLGALYFSPKERIEVVEISGERIVLGVAPGSVNYIITLKDTNENTSE
ncbi:FliO/MopB family protein [Desulfocicer niacini]